MFRRSIVGLGMVLLVACGSTASAPTLSVTDPHHGHEVPVRCGGLAVDDCAAVADQMLAHVGADAAKVEGISIEPMEEAPPGSRLAARVTMDHEVMLESGEQPYLVIQSGDGAFAIEIILDD